MSTTLARARALLGVPFRPHGRDPATGLDCVGFVAAALGIDEVPTGYGLRSTDRRGLAAAIASAGLNPVVQPSPGALVALDAPAGLHLAIASDTGLIHACARLRRVIERPGPYPWPLAGAWQPRS